MRRSRPPSALADALDARRVPATWLVGPQPHPEVAAWATARRRVGDAVLLHGTRTEVGAGRPYRRLPAHEAGLRLAGALRSRDVLGLAVDGFAAPGWSTSDGTRTALAAAGVGLLLDDAGVAPSRRRRRTGHLVAGARGRPGARAHRVAAVRPAVARSPSSSTSRCTPGRPRRPSARSSTTPSPAVRRRWARASSSGAVPRRRTGATGDPEDWSITA